MRKRNVKYLQYLLHLGTVLNSWLVLNASTAGLEITRVRQTNKINWSTDANAYTLKYPLLNWEGLSEGLREELSKGLSEVLREGLSEELSEGLRTE